jgi:hypothetical protein
MADQSEVGTSNRRVGLWIKHSPNSVAASSGVRLTPIEQNAVEYGTKLSSYMKVILDDPSEEISVYKFSFDYETDGDDHDYRINKADVLNIYENEWFQFMTSSPLDSTGTSMIEELQEAVDLNSNSNEITNILLISLYTYLRDCKKHSDYIKGGRYYVDTSSCGHTECRIVNFGLTTFVYQDKTYQIPTPPLCKFCLTQRCIEQDWEHAREEITTQFLIAHPEMKPSDLEHCELGTSCMWPNGDVPEDERIIKLEGYSFTNDLRGVGPPASSSGDSSPLHEPSPEDDAEPKTRFFDFVVEPHSHKFRLIRSYTDSKGKNI